MLRNHVDDLHVEECSVMYTVQRDSVFTCMTAPCIEGAGLQGLPEGVRGDARHEAGADDVHHWGLCGALMSTMCATRE